MFGQKLKEMKKKTIPGYKFLPKRVRFYHLKNKTQTQKNKCGKAIHLNNLESVKAIQKPEYKHGTNQA